MAGEWMNPRKEALYLCRIVRLAGGRAAFSVAECGAREVSTPSKTPKSRLKASNPYPEPIWLLLTHVAPPLRTSALLDAYPLPMESPTWLSSRVDVPLNDTISQVSVRGREMGLDDPFPIEKCSGRVRGAILTEFQVGAPRSARSPASPMRSGLQSPTSARQRWRNCAAWRRPPPTGRAISVRQGCRTVN
jgi:hypothetical protein